MPRALLILFLSLLAIPSGIAQADSIRNLPKDKQIQALWKTYYIGHEREIIADSTWLVKFDQLESDLQRSGHSDLAQQAWLMRQAAHAHLVHECSPAGAAVMEQAVQTAHHNGWEVIEAECMMYTGLVYYAQRQYGPAFDLMLRSYARMKDLGFDQLPHLRRHAVHLAHGYYRFQEYEKAIEYLRESISPRDPWFAHHTYNTLGLCHQKRMQYDSAIYYYTLSRDAAMMAKDTFWAALTDGNRGKAYSLSGRYDEAMPLLMQDHAKSKQAGEVGSALTSALELAHIHLLRQQKEEAGPYLDFAALHIPQKDYRSKSRYYSIRSTWKKAYGDVSTALAYADSAMLYRDSLMQFDDAYASARTKEQAEIAQYTENIRLLENARDRQILLRNGMLVILLLSGSIIALWINRKRLKNHKERELQRMQQHIAENELQLAQTELEAFTETVRQKNELIESIQTEIDHLRNTARDMNSERAEQINALIHATILTEDEWREFRRRFDNVHPAFFGLIKETYPDLTPADLRLLALTKLKLAPREMMSMLGVSYDAIKKSRKRLIARLDLPDEDNLADFIQNLESGAKT